MTNSTNPSYSPVAAVPVGPAVSVATNDDSTTSGCGRLSVENRERIRFAIRHPNNTSSPATTLLQRIAIVLGGITGVLFVIGSIAYAQHCAQVLANTIHGTVYWSPYLAGMLGLVVLLCQGILVTFLMKPCLSVPTGKRYTNEGIETIGKVVDRYVINHQQSSNRRGRRERNVYRVILVYPARTFSLRESVHAKEFQVREIEFQQTEFPLLVLPRLPTSAITMSQHHELMCCSKPTLKFGSIGLIAPILWILVSQYSKLPSNDYWITNGLRMLFGDSLVCSFCLAHWKLADLKQKALFGGATEISDSWIPSNFFGAMSLPAVAEEVTETEMV